MELHSSIFCFYALFYLWYMNKLLNNIFKVLFSNISTLILLLLLIIVIAIATFIENSYDTITANTLVFNTIWFESLLVLLCLNFIVNIKKHNLIRKEKLGSLLLHSALVLMILGAAFTRHIGFDGEMHLREGEISNEMISAEPYFKIETINKELSYVSHQPIYFSQIGKNKNQITINDSIQVVFNNYYWNNARNTSLRIDTLSIIIIIKDKSFALDLLFDHSRYKQQPQILSINNLDYHITYGPKLIKLPFYVELIDFKIINYEGTNTPSAYVSTVKVIDENKESVIEEITKNKVLNYQGYRFFQTIFDNDEQGTVLSINCDFWGTTITYFGYILLGVSFVLLFFAKHSRFNKISHDLRKLKLPTKTTITLLILFCSFSIKAQNNNHKYSKKEHIAEFSSLLVQTYDGRVAPLHSLANNVLRKVSKKEYVNIPNYGKFEAIEVYWGMIVNHEFWKNQNIIYVKNDELQNFIGAENNYISFNKLFKNNQYILEEQLKGAFNKDPQLQTNLDKEIILLTERVNICLYTYQLLNLKILPNKIYNSYLWSNWSDSLAYKPLTKGHNKKTFHQLIQDYFQSCLDANVTNNYSIPSNILSTIKEIQINNLEGELPSQDKIRIEIAYNKLNIFKYLKYIYFLLSFVIVIFFIKTPKKLVRINTNHLFLLFISLSLLIHSIGLIIRWYITEHAPWSNGYEVLLFLSWGTILAGIYLSKDNLASLAVTCFLAFVFLLTASHSFYNPQLTLLQPILKSNWLIFHVATITIGYSFLALSFIYGLLHVFLITIIKTLNTNNKLQLNRLTLINEKSIYIGLFFTIVGTFLGAVWANESWGRYWGWDPKETWSLIIIVTYSLLLHLRLIPQLKTNFCLNVGSIISFGTVIMTFVGVNYYFKNGLHSYTSDSTPIFPIWAWISIASILLLIILAIIRNKKNLQL